jgi:hypothetical protein
LFTELMVGLFRRNASSRDIADWLAGSHRRRVGSCAKEIPIPPEML